MSGTVRRRLWVAYAVYLLSVAWLVWDPTSTGAGSGVTGLVGLAARLGITVQPSWVEFGLNVAMLVPLSLVGGLLFPRLRVVDWTLTGFAVSVLIEVVQVLALPTRTASARDVAANTVGTWLGAVALFVLVTLWERRQASRPPAT